GHRSARPLLHPHHEAGRNRALLRNGDGLRRRTAAAFPLPRRVALQGRAGDGACGGRGPERPGRPARLPRRQGGRHERHRHHRPHRLRGDGRGRHARAVERRRARLPGAHGAQPRPAPDLRRGPERRDLGAELPGRGGAGRVL
ncbi:MAG: Putative dioxygenase, partial [uncultured Acetobacteraceae bacterium]